MDPVTKYLHNLGFKTTPAYFGNSFYEYGKRWDMPGWTLVYRFENNVMVICDFTSKGKPEGLSSAVAQVVKHLKTIKKVVPEVEFVRGLVMENSPVAAQRKTMTALKNIYLANDARVVEIDGEEWIEY